MMRVAGLMSGTSADGIDVAFVRITGRDATLRARLEEFCTLPYPAAVRREILKVANANRAATLSVAEISQLNFLLGELFAEAVVRAARRFRIPLRSIDLIGSHGQTVFHKPTPGRFAGRRIVSTLQLGEPQVIAERTGIPVVANFRPRDMAAGGQGAPLVPFVDYLLYRHPRKGRVALNLGGIANVTVIPASARANQVIAFDTGPGNMVIDAVVEKVTRQRLDRDGRLARRGRPLEALLTRLLRHPYFKRRPPKSTGREEFGRDFAATLIRQAAGRPPAADLVRTATELTVRSLADAFRRFILPRTLIDEVIVGGGGAYNHVLMSRLQKELRGLRWLPAGNFGVDAKAKEAFAFAVLAYHTWHGWPATLPSATGARRPVPLGVLVPR